MYTFATKVVCFGWAGGNMEASLCTSPRVNPNPKP